MESGERIFEALLKTGWDIDITDEGHITATRAGTQTQGKIDHNGSIEWFDAVVAEKALLEARILELRNRAMQVQTGR
jgi:hypothetical protein